MLASLGYRFDGDDLTEFEAACFSIIANEFNKQEELEMKKNSRKKK